MDWLETRIRRLEQLAGPLRTRTAEVERQRRAIAQNLLGLRAGYATTPGVSTNCCSGMPETVTLEYSHWGVNYTHTLTYTTTTPVGAPVPAPAWHAAVLWTDTAWGANAWPPEWIASPYMHFMFRCAPHEGRWKWQLAWNYPTIGSTSIFWSSYTCPPDVSGTESGAYDPHPTMRVHT